MTPDEQLELTVEERKRLAEIVTQIPHVISDGRVCVKAYDRQGNSTVVGDEWSPSLTGDDWQKSQALDCIVAAFNLPGIIDCSKHKDCGYYFVYEDDERQCIDATPNGNDILDAAIRALLAQEKV